MQVNKLLILLHSLKIIFKKKLLNSNVIIRNILINPEYDTGTVIPIINELYAEVPILGIC